MRFELLDEIVGVSAQVQAEEARKALPGREFEARELKLQIGVVSGCLESADRTMVSFCVEPVYGILAAFDGNPEGLAVFYESLESIRILNPKLR